MPKPLVVTPRTRRAALSPSTISPAPASQVPSGNIPLGASQSAPVMIRTRARAISLETGAWPMALERAGGPEFIYVRVHFRFSLGDGS